jgi:hypothetical protein
MIPDAPALAPAAVSLAGPTHVVHAPEALDALDAAERIEGAVCRVLGANVVARGLAAEITTVHYAFFARRRPVPPGAHVVAQRAGRSPALAWGLALVIAVESAVLHLWLAPNHPALAWTLTALGIYSLLWIAGQVRALGSRESVIADDALVLRVGLQLTARLRREQIASAERLDWRTVPLRARDYLDAARPGEPNVLLTLRAPTAVTTALGLRRSVTRIGLRVDDPSGLLRALGSTG